MPLRFISLIAALALCLGAALGWVARAAAEELNAAETAGPGTAEPVSTVPPANVSGPVFDIGGASAAGKWVEQVNRTAWWYAVVMLGEAERIAAQNVGSGVKPSTVVPTAVKEAAPDPAPSSGDCYGGPVSDDIVNRESGGDPNAQNGIYSGCFQIGEPWWNGRCSHLDRSVAGQKACAQIIMDTQGPSAWQ